MMLPISIEFARARGHGPEMPTELSEDYLAALKHIPALVMSLPDSHGDDWPCRLKIAAFAVGLGQPILGAAIMELDTAKIKKFFSGIN